jgi:galactokinase
MKTLQITTPGRICLFGEHQDYLQLPVIAAAISLRNSLVGQPQSGAQSAIHLPDIQKVIYLDLQKTPHYHNSRDYWRSGLAVMQRHGFVFEQSVEVTFKSQIPINAGTSSSSAMLVSWLHFLSQIAQNTRPVAPQELAYWAYQAEVEEFGEAGGMMDHFSTSVGRIIYLESSPQIQLTSFSPNIGTFVLGNSHEPKDTVGILKFVKNGMLNILQKIRKVWPDFDLKTANILDISSLKEQFSKQEWLLLKANLGDRDICQQARQLFENENFDEIIFGDLLNQHQRNLREFKKISTPKIDRMIEASLRAGALGAKINGSGGGGCMFAYAPRGAEEVAEAIQQAGGTPFIIQVAEGTNSIF